MAFATFVGTYTKHGPGSMDHPMDPVHGPPCISKVSRVCGLRIYGSAIPKQPANTRQTVKDVSNTYESVFSNPDLRKIFILTGAISF